jgi:hypothetical protein
MMRKAKARRISLIQYGTISAMAMARAPPPDADWAR